MQQQNSPQQQQQHDSMMNTSSISTHLQAQQQLQQQQASGNTATVAHQPLSAHALYDLYRQSTTNPQGASVFAAETARAQATVASPPAATGTPVPPNALPAQAATTMTALEAKEQRQQIINHVNALIEYCEIPQKNKNERITSVRQCSSSFFVLLCQRLFKENISGINIYPNTPQRKKDNVELVLAELRKHKYNVDGISAEQVVQLNETDLSRLILLFVGIAQEDGMVASGDVDRFTGGGASVGASPLQPSTPYGGAAGTTLPSQGYTIAEVPSNNTSQQQQQQHFSRQNVVGPVNDVSDGQQPLYPGGDGYYYPPVAHHTGAAYHLPYNLSAQEQHPPYDMSGNVGEMYVTDGANLDVEGGYLQPQASSGYVDESQVPPEEGASLYEEDDDMVPRDEYVSSWNQGVVMPKVAVKMEHRRPTEPVSLPQEILEVQRRIKEAERRANESLLRSQRQHRSGGGEGPTVATHPRHHKDGARRGSRVATDGPIPTPSSPLTPTNSPPSIARRSGGSLGAGEDDTPGRHSFRHGAEASRVPRDDRQQQYRQQQPRSLAARSIPFAEPPLTRVECRLLASHPNRLIDAEARDEKIQRLRAARFLGNAQSHLRQQLRRTYDSELSSMREELKSSLKLAHRDKLDLMRRVRDENDKYMVAYASLMEAAAKDPRVSRHFMSSSTAQHAAFYKDSLRESRRMCDYLQQESERRNLAELARYAKTTSDWQQRMPV